MSRGIPRYLNLIPPLGRRAWMLLGGYTVEKIGSGLTSPFLILYLSQARGLGLGMAGLVLSVGSTFGVIGVTASGGLVDRLGAGKAALMTIAVAVGGVIGLAMARLPWIALAGAALLGAGTAGMWNAFASMLASAVVPEHRGNVFGVAFACQNLGLGFGAIVGGMIADVRSLRSFLWIFGGNAIAYLIFGFLLTVLGESRAQMAGGHLEPPHEISTRSQADYRSALRDRGLISIACLNAAFAVFSSAFRDTIFPVWATGPAGVGTGVVGTAFMASTFSVVVLQLPVLHFLLKRHRRTSAISASAVLFGVACAAAFLAGKAHGLLLAAGILIVSMVVLGFGDTMLQPSLYAMVNDQAPGPLRGRYNAVFNLAWQFGSMVGPVAAGVLLAARHYGAILLGLCSLCAVTTLGALGLERRIPRSSNNVTA